MASSKKTEMKRGWVEASKQFEVLRATWPKAFPAKLHDVRPLAPGVVTTIAKELGWTPPYARAVLEAWKRTDAYCRAVLSYSLRIALDGALTDAPVDDKAREDARKMLEQRQARRRRDAERAARRQALALSPEDQRTLAAAVINPPAPNEALQRAAQHYLTAVKSG